MSKKHLAPYLPLGLVLLIFLGCFFRFYHLDSKVYWHDEVYTSVRVAGYDGEEVTASLFNNQLLKPQDLLQFQVLDPERPRAATWRALANHPEHPPLYYILVRFWTEIWGSSVTSVRALSALFSLLIFPAFLWFCWQLFSSPQVAWTGLALLSISPIYVLYAQEAREYSLWTFTILLSYGTFLTAIKCQRFPLLYWFLYALSLALSLYTSLLSIFVVIAQGIYLLLSAYSKKYYYLAAVTVAFLLFSPWLLIVVGDFNKLQHKTHWATLPVPLETLISNWELHLTSMWLDVYSRFNLFFTPRVIVILIMALSYTIYFVWRQGESKATVLILTLILTPSLGLILPDLLLGGQRSMHSRYFFPCYLGIQVAVSYWLVFTRSARLKTIILSTIIVLGILSCMVSAGAHTWWNKVVGYYHPQIAAIINSSPQPLVIIDRYDINSGNLISLAYLLEDKVNLLFLAEPTLPPLPPAQDIFLYNPSPELYQKLKNYLEDTEINNFFHFVSEPQ